MKSELTVPLMRISDWLAPASAMPPAELAPWLFDTGSMTARLRRHNDHFSLELLGHHQQALTPDEQALLGVVTGLRREVILHGDGGPAVLGWTLFADEALVGAALDQLGEQPLGERIFGAAPASRDCLQLARFELVDGVGESSAVWGRRSRLYLNGWPLLVHEVLLPGLARSSQS
ncbi:chorismate--pyruvate lyase family protein [Aeromonas molluscorum]|uniref:Probable chorismate pyruvate-lyase n=1 Tax=Aeromonas molluscorum 848 TaxID=1268236 RepID=R1HD15_9GAMM|nr:chorismate lyase [Aeromonas molluscorum]EOD56304.1 chorismate--pyruvate lyase [Aeromonas molluscorum 848]